MLRIVSKAGSSISQYKVFPGTTDGIIATPCSRFVNSSRPSYEKIEKGKRVALTPNAMARNARSWSVNFNASLTYTTRELY